MTNGTTLQKGGHGVVGVGTLRLPKAAKELVLKLKSIAEGNALSPEKLKKALPKLKEKLNIWPPEIDAMAEMIKMTPEALKKWRPKMKVAVKMLEWNRDDTEESTKFFK
ncbi:hypothetical protein FS837_006446, partial [Tulasnella sp. UAMH 9824]